METKSRVRTEAEVYPDYTAELEAIRTGGITTGLLDKIIQKHLMNAAYNRRLYNRYRVLNGCVPIFNRRPRFHMLTPDGKEVEPINNKVNNDFFGEIVDFKVGYFAGAPASYSYSQTEESIEETAGNEEGVKAARKAITDFVTRNNMHDIDMEVTKHAAIYGYCGRLFYHDKDGNERVKVVPGYETIVLSDTTIAEPEYAVHYFSTTDINGAEYWTAEFYSSAEIQIYTGQLGALSHKETIKNLYDYCPLQGIPNNGEMTGDAEKVMTAIDSYDRTVSDSSNQIEGQVNSKEIYENLNVPDEEIAKSNYTGALNIMNPTGKGKVYKLESNINDSFVEHYLSRLLNDIYRFSKTPNLTDQDFGNASGNALRFKLTAHETKCGMFEAKMKTAGVYMFKLLASSWGKKRLNIDPLQCVVEFKRNFPLDILNEAQAAQALITAGIPKEVAYSLAISSVDDVDYIMQMIEAEKNGIPSLEEHLPEDGEIDSANQGGANRVEDSAEENQLLNGAQIQALTNIIEQVGSGMIPRDAAIEIVVTTLGISRENAEKMI